MGVDNPVLNDLTMQLTNLYMNRTEIAQYSKEKNPTLKSIDLQITTTKNALYENMKSAINTNDIALKEINDRVAQINPRRSAICRKPSGFFSASNGNSNLPMPSIPTCCKRDRKPRSPRLPTFPIMKWWMRPGMED